jgi:hypothetical protein
MVQLGMEKTPFRLLSRNWGNMFTAALPRNALSKSIIIYIKKIMCSWPDVLLLFKSLNCIFCLHHKSEAYKGRSTLASRASSWTLLRALNTSIVGEHSFEPNLVARNANRLQRAISRRFLAVASKEVRCVVTHCSGRHGMPNLELTGTVRAVWVLIR